MRRTRKNAAALGAVRVRFGPGQPGQDSHSMARPDGHRPVTGLCGIRRVAAARSGCVKLLKEPIAVCFAYWTVFRKGLSNYHFRLLIWDGALLVRYRSPITDVGFIRVVYRVRSVIKCWRE
jgi:hypothetical protein